MFVMNYPGNIKAEVTRFYLDLCSDASMLRFIHRFFTFAGPFQIFVTHLHAGAPTPATVMAGTTTRTIETGQKRAKAVEFG